MTYRFATLQDWDAYETMLRSYLLEQEKAGSPVRLTRRTLDRYRDLARSYLQGSLFGFVILAEQDGMAGFVLCGEDFGQSPLDVTGGREIVVWIAWVEPPHRKAGAALAMLSFGRPKAVEMGFETALMSVRESNVEGLELCRSFGAQPVERILRFDLGKEAPDGR